MTEVSEVPTTDVLDDIRGFRDVLTVRRVFGEAYELDGVTVIPVARVVGGGGGGGGDDGRPEGEGSGFGAGFGMGALALGVYQVRDGEVVWKPAVDVSRLARGGQVLAGIIAVCVTLVLLRRSG